MPIRNLAGVIVLGAAVWCAASAPCEEQAVAEPEHYRNEDYRVPTPRTLRGARVVTTPQAEALWRSGTAVFVDVMPHVARPADLPARTLWRGKPRHNIPGSIWLADTGYGELSASTEAHLRTGLEQITGGERARLVVIYCLRDCWMGWNAAKRAVSWGYSAIAWYPDGTDGWREAGLPLSEATPMPPPRE